MELFVRGNIYMDIIRETIYKTNRTIIDADVSPLMTVVLHKGKGENIVTVNECDVFSVSAQAYMIRILDEDIVIYDGHKLQFFTVEGICTLEKTVGSHLYDLLPMKDAVACSYKDQGVYEHEFGERKIFVVHKDGAVMSYDSFANEHQLNFDIRFARIKPYACLSFETNSIVHFTADFQLQKTVSCPFIFGDIIAIGYRYPYYFFIEENKFIYMHEDGLYREIDKAFSYNVRSSYHRGPFVFLEILEQEVVGYIFAE